MNSHANLLPRYKHLREVGRDVVNALVKSLPKDVVEESGKALGILRNNVFVMESEAEMALVMDHAIHDVRRQGRNAVERYLAETPPPPDSDEMLYLQGLRDARFAVLFVEAVEPGVGIQVRDVRRGENFFVMDVGFGTTAVPGLVMAARVHTVENITMTTGAALPLGEAPEQNREAFLQEWVEVNRNDNPDRLSPEEAAKRNTELIRMFREQGGSSRIVYQNLPEESARPRLPSAPGRPRLAPPAASATTHIGRNDPCPCGSGKKFKNCCLRKK